MKNRIKTPWTSAFSLALQDFVDNHPQCCSAMISDLENIANLSLNCYSVEIIFNASVDDDKEFVYDENL